MYTIIVHDNMIIRCNTQTGQTWFINGTSWEAISEPAGVVKQTKQVKVGN